MSERISDTNNGTANSEARTPRFNRSKTVQVITHITDEIKRRIQLLAQTKKYDVIITEIGGTVGDIESQPFIESVRQLRYSLGY